MVARNAFEELAQEHVTPSGAHLVGNARSKFRDGFASPITQPDSTEWQLDVDNTGTWPPHIVTQGGDGGGSAYLRISMSPFVDDSTVRLTSKQKFRAPTKVAFGITQSQRVLGNELFFGMVEANDADQYLIKRTTAQPADVPLTQIVVASNLGTVSAPRHGFKSGDRVIIVGCPDTRLNVGPVIVTATGANTFTVPLTVTAATYSGASVIGGAVRHADPLSRADNGFGHLFENASATQATWVARRNRAKYRLTQAQTIVTTVASQSVAQQWVDSLIAPGTTEFMFNMDEVSWRSWGSDAMSAMTNNQKFTQNVPEEDADYRVHIRARNLDYMSKPIARIVSIAKTGSTTATITTDRPHNLTTLSYVGVYGSRDQSNNANNSNTPVTSVVNSTTFTIAIGVGATLTDTNGGVVFINHGSTNSPGALSVAIQSISRDADGVVSVITNSALGTTVMAGEVLHLWGLNGTNAAQFEGAYRILGNASTTLVLEPAVGNRVLDNAIGSINTGGALIRRTEHRVHYVRVMDHTRVAVDVHGGRGATSDANNAVPTVINSIPTINTSVLPHTSEQNESVTPLASGALYTGVTRDMGSDASRRAAKMRVSVRHLAGTTPGAAYMESSDDSTTWTEQWRQPIPSDDRLHVYDIPIPTRYVRFRFQNGSIVQTAFRFHTVRFFVNDGGFSNPSKKDFPLGFAAAQASAAVASMPFDLGVNEYWDEATFQVFGDQAGTLFIDHSSDGSNWRTEGNGQALAAGTFVTLTQKIQRRYVRFRFVNGASAQTALDASATLRSR